MLSPFKQKSEIARLEIQCLNKLLNRQNNVLLTIVKTLHR